MTRPSRVAVCDAGPILHLDELGCLSLLHDFDRLVIAPAVREEVHRHRPRCLLEVAVAVELVNARNAEAHAPLAALCRAFALDRGEVEALALMEDLPGALFLTDDAAARLVGQQLGYRVHGTIGLIVRSVRRGQKTPAEAVRTLESVPTLSTLHIRPALLEEVIAAVRAEFGLG